ncbi:hypothetical protein ACFWGN_10325 [Oerskovia sp. NPDC060338]|uniref:hypothetical protein n=1 Tax=Oerskovia sp. NPDC060338 TaxID=3347100 RepID=UPI00364954AD
MAVVLAVCAVSAVLPLLWNRRFYWWDDTVNGAFGQWYHTGMSLRTGTLPMLEPSVWSSGNLFAEGQWGTYNPIVWLIALGSTLVASAALFTTIVKLAAIMIGAVGVYFLARHLGARDVYAVLAGVTAPFSGFTTYFDAPSWVTGLFAWALIPWVWLLVRRSAFDGRSPLPAFLVAYLTITIGYVHGTIALVFILASVLVQGMVRRDRRAILIVLGIGSLAGLVAVAVHLPSLLTASVTNRSGTGVYMDQFMTLDLSGLAMSSIATALPQVASWWWAGLTAAVPMAYIAWSLPLVAFIDLPRAAAVVRKRLDVVIAGGLFFLFLMLPTVVGPLRYPSRMMPYLALTVVLLLAVLLSKARVDALRVGRLALALGLAALGFYLSWAQTPHLATSHLLSALIVAVAIIALYLCWRRPVQRGRSWAATSWATLSIIAVASIATLALQHSTHRAPAWPDQGLPSRVEGFQQQLEGAVNDTLVVGDTQALLPEPALWDETLQANTWYVNPHNVMNRYQLLGYGPFNATMCLEYLGGTCPELLTNLFEVREATGLRLVDQIRIDTLQIVKADVPEELWAQTPEGWTTVNDGRFTRTWVRDEPLGPAGGVVWSAPGVSVTEVSTTNTSVVFRVDSLPDSGPRTVAFSRLPWPGYSTSDGRITAPTDLFLLTVEVPEGAEGDEVTVTFRPPGWNIELACLAIALTLAALWALVFGVRGRRGSSRSGVDPAAD